jgi:putative methyltransferase (TIGR04325 family)
MPPVLVRWARRLVHERVFSGDFATWSEARARCSGYDSPLILERVTAAARAVRDGHAAYERDSVTFAEPAPHWPLLSCLMYAAARTGGRLEVLDFGGSLGSLYFQHRAWMDHLAAVRWRIVEQQAFVEVGRREFAVGGLSFHLSLEEACAEGRPSVVLLSSVLPYLEKPHDLLADIVQRGFPFVLIDRTGCVRSGGRDRLLIQRVPPSIYPASYPCWFFDYSGLVRHFARDYALRGKFAGFDRADIEADFAGLFFERAS